MNKKPIRDGVNNVVIVSEEELFNDKAIVIGRYTHYVEAHNTTTHPSFAIICNQDYTVEQLYNVILFTFSSVFIKQEYAEKSFYVLCPINEIELLSTKLSTNSTRQAVFCILGVMNSNTAVTYFSGINWDDTGRMIVGKTTMNHFGLTAEYMKNIIQS